MTIAVTRRARETTSAAPPLPEKLLYKIPDAMRLLSMSRSVIYEQIRAGRLRVVKQGRATLVPASAITDYITLLEREAQEVV
jgi:excisionase family DNA binding protein